jgi:serine/threonine protein kinase
MAPELLLNLKYYTAAVDVWSLGISLYYVYTGVKPNNASCSRDALAGMLIFVGYDRMIELYEKYRPRADLRTLGMMGKYRDEPGVLENVLGEELEVGVARLLRRMLVVDPEERASMEELLSDEYFREVFEFSPPYEEKNRMKKLKKMMKMEQVSANTEDED